MADLDHILRTVVEPGLDLLPSRMDTNPARVLMMAIGLQESRLVHRRQIGGPARGLWQFEQGGGVVGVLRHRASAAHARQVCAARKVEPVAAEVYQALAVDDILAAAFARLLLFTDPRPLPRPEAGPQAAWDYYIRNWRPGKPHRHTWSALHAEAVAAVRCRPEYADAISRANRTGGPA